MQHNPLPVNNSVLSVSGLNRLVRDCLESNFPLTWIGGEVSNLTKAASGHVYFSLKDAEAQVRCVMWRNKAQLLGWRLENGQKIEARALVSFYEPRGEFQLNIDSIRRAGQGDLFERFLRLKEQLDGEGLFAAESKRPLPSFPRRLCIVTSLQAAALRDVLSTLHRRAPQVAISVVPTPVQGEGAAEKIAKALGQASDSGADAIILCRGGGSIEDLWSFNEECVARAIRATAVPVVSGIGHETDFTIADFAADLRAPTPTAAAELIAPQQAELRRQIEDQLRQLGRQMDRYLTDRQQRLDWIASHLTHPRERLRQHWQDLIGTGRQLTGAFNQQTGSWRLQQARLRQRLTAAKPHPGESRERLARLGHRLAYQLHRTLSTHNGKLNSLTGSLKQLDPLAVLSRGYTLAIGPDGKAVRNAASLSAGDRIRLDFAHGSAQATVDQVVLPGEAD